MEYGVLGTCGVVCGCVQIMYLECGVWLCADNVPGVWCVWSAWCMVKVIYVVM